jgi:hypothetical protein
MEGLSRPEVNPSGPVQLKVSPVEKGVAFNISVPSGVVHNGALLDAVTIGKGCMTTLVLSVSCTPNRVLIT